MNRILSKVCCAISSCFFLTYPIVALAKKKGWRRSGSGFVGTLAGVFSVGLLPAKVWPCLLTLTGFVLLTVVITEIAEESLGQKDDQRIVLDEWIGTLITLALLPQTAAVLAAGFVLFRVLDTLKPLGVHHLARLPGGWGIVLDDVGAAVLANVILRVLPGL